MNTPLTLPDSNRSSLFDTLANLLLSPYGLILLYLLLYILPLGLRPLGIPDEMRYAEIPREMLATGDWVSPHLNGLRYFEKPPFGYWLNAISMQLFGQTPFAVRLPSALAAGLTAAVVWLFTRRSTSDRRVANVTALIYLSFFGVFLIGTYAVLDTLFTLGLTCTIVLFYLGAQTASGWQRTTLFITCGVAAGLSFLTKGFLAIVLPGLVLFPWLLWCRHWQLLWGQVWIVLVVIILVVLPWGLQIHFQEPDFWRYFIVEEHLKRFAGEDAQHRAPVYYYLITLPLLMFPWVGLLPAVLNTQGKPDHGFRVDPAAFKLLVCWSVLPFLFFSLSRGKLATYLLPCLVPIAIFCALGLCRYLHLPPQRLFTWGVRVIGGIWGLVTLGYVLTQFLGVGEAIYNSEEWASALILEATLLSTLIFIYLSLRNQTSNGKIVYLALSILPFTYAYSIALPDQLIDRKAPTRFLQQFPSGFDPATIVIADASLVHSVAWEFKRTDIYLLGRGELGYGLDHEESTDRLLDSGSFPKFASQLSSDEKVFIFFRKDAPDWLKELLPTHAKRVTQGSLHAILNEPKAR